MKFINWLDRHKTKITGFFLVVAGSLQANTVLLQPVLSAKGYAIFTIVVGCAVAALGFINGSRQPKP